MSTKKSDIVALLAEGQRLGSRYIDAFDVARDKIQECDRAFCEFALWAYKAEVAGVDQDTISPLVGRHKTSVGHMQAVGMIIAECMNENVDAFFGLFHISEISPKPTKVTGKMSISPVVGSKGRSFESCVKAFGKQNVQTLVLAGLSGQKVVETIVAGSKSETDETEAAIKSAVSRLSKVQENLAKGAVLSDESLARVSEIVSLVSIIVASLTPVTAEEYQTVNA